MYKEKQIWLGISSIIITIIGMILSLIPQTQLQGIALIGIAFILSIVGLALNFKQKHLVALLSLLVVISSANITAGVSAVSRYTSELNKNVPYDNYSDDDSYNSNSDDYDYNLDSDDETEDLSVSQLKKYKIGDKISINGGHFKINYVKNVNHNYVDINVTYSATNRSYTYNYSNLEVASNEYDTLMTGIYNATASSELGASTYNYLYTGTVEKGKSITGDLLYDSADGTGEYLVMSVDGTRKIAVELNN